MWRFIVRSTAIWIVIDAVAFLALRVVWNARHSETGWDTPLELWPSIPRI
jgi:hypothetical protein